MQITGIEVVGHNTPIGIRVPVGEKISLTYDQTLRVSVSLNYRGRATTRTLYGSIGQRQPVIGFDEILASEVGIKLPESPTAFTACQYSVDIPITAQIAPGTDYDLYCKIKENPEAGKPEVDNVIDIVGIPPTYELLEETIYPYAYVYDGDAEVSTFTFKSDPFTPASWLAGKLATAVQAEVEKAGGRVMEMRVYVDRTPLLWTGWQIEIVGIPASTTAGIAAPVGIYWWAIAILAALAIALIIVITWSIKTIVEIFKRRPLSPEIKAAWSRETLISVIGDFESKLERTPTPSGELEAMSDGELRDYCDQLAEAIVPPKISWVPIAILGGLGILGAGAAMALATRRK